MDLEKNSHKDAKKINRDILLGKPSDCKYCKGISKSVVTHLIWRDGYEQT